MDDELRAAIERDRKAKEEREKNAPPPFYLENDYSGSRKMRLTAKIPKQKNEKNENKKTNNGNNKQNTKSKKTIKETKKGNGWKKALAIGVAGSIGVGTWTLYNEYQKYKNDLDETVGIYDACAMGYKEKLALDEDTIKEFQNFQRKFLSGEDSSEKAVKYQADAIVNCGIKIIKSKIANVSNGKYSIEDITLKQGKLDINDKLVSYIDIDGEKYTSNNSSEHKVSEKITDCIDEIIYIQEIQDYLDNGRYNAKEDFKQIREVYSKAVKEIDKTAAYIVTFAPNGDIEVETILSKDYEEFKKNKEKEYDER